MTLLETYKQKKTWKNQFPIILGYQSKKTHLTDIDLAHVLQYEPILTFDVNSYSGFEEVDVVPLPFDYKRLQEQYHFRDPNDAITQMINTLKDYFRENWDSKILHVLATSAGRDSRLIALVLKQLEIEEGFDLGELLFICHGYQGTLFKKVMKKMGWNDDQYKVYREGKELDIDYYDPPNFNESVNAYQGPQLEFYGDIDKSKTCFVSGIYSFDFHDIDRYIGLNYRFYVSRNIHSTIDEYARWGDVMLPFLSYEYITKGFCVPVKWHVTQRDGSDDIKDGLNTSVGNTLPYEYLHNYNWEFSEKWVDKVNLDYMNSNFYFEFDNIEIRNARPGKMVFYRRESLESRLYGLATTFEKINTNYVECKCNKDQRYTGSTHINVVY